MSKLRNLGGFNPPENPLATPLDARAHERQTTLNYPAGRNDLERCYLPERGPDQTGKQISKQTKLRNIFNFLNY